MTFTPLETICISALVGFLCSIFTRIWCNRIYVTRIQCELQRGACHLGEIKNDLVEIKQVQESQRRELAKMQQHQLIFYRILLTKLSVTQEEQEKLLGGISG